MKKFALLFLSLLLLSLGAQAQESFGLANSSIGTTLNTLTKVVNTAGTPQAQIMATTDTSGAVGITTLGNGASGTAIITRSGIAPCVFDNTTVAGDFVQIASGTAGDCHDVGSTRPTSGQIIGVVIQAGGSAGTYNVLLDKSILPSSSGTTAPQSAVGSSDTLSAAGTFATTLSVPAPVGVGSIIEINANGTYTTTATSSPLFAFQFNAGGTTGVCPQVGSITLPTSQTGPWTLHCFIQIVTTGAPGTAFAWGEAREAGSAGGTPTFKMMTNLATASFTTTSAQTLSVQETATLVSGQTLTLQNLTVRSY